MDAKPIQTTIKHDNRTMVGIQELQYDEHGKPFVVALIKDKGEIKAYLDPDQIETPSDNLTAYLIYKELIVI